MRAEKFAHAKTLAFLIFCVASVLFADDFKTIDGKEYKNVTVSRVEPDGIMITSKSGILKLYFVELAKEVQERFHYDPAKAAEFTAKTSENINELLQQRAALAQTKAEERAKYWAEQEEIKRQQEAEIQRKQQIAEQQRQAQMEAAARWTNTRSQEGVPEHTYEILQDYTILIGTGPAAIRVRLRRGEQYRGRILADHAEIDINGISYPVPSGILSLPKD